MIVLKANNISNYSIGLYNGMIFYFYIHGIHANQIDNQQNTSYQL